MSFLHNVAEKVYANKAVAPVKKMMVAHHTPVVVAAPKITHVVHTLAAATHAAPKVTVKPETALQK